MAVSMKTVPHIAVVLHVQGEPELEREVVFWVEACRKQLLEDVAVGWGDWANPPGVFFYGVSERIPSNEAAVVGIFSDANNPEAAGYHSAVGKMVLGAVDLSRSRSPSRTLSHELCEIYRNAYLNAWLPSPVEGRAYAAELCDPVQRSEYRIEATVLGESRQVTVGDFLMPGWFGLPNPQAGSSKRTWCDTVGQPFEIAPGGYQIALEGDSILYLPARNEAIARASIDRPLSRTKQISQGITIPHPEPQT
jgi:hypothetical protein